MGQLEGNRAAIFDNRIRERVWTPQKIQAGWQKMGTPSRQTALKFAKNTQAIESSPSGKDHVLASPTNRNMQNETPMTVASATPGDENGWLRRQPDFNNLRFIFGRTQIAHSPAAAAGISIAQSR